MAVRTPRKLTLVPSGMTPPEAEVGPSPDGLSDTQRLGQVIREARRAKGWSLRDLDRASGVASNYLWSIEKPGKSIRRPGAEILGKLAHALDLSMDDLYVRVGWLPKKVDAPDFEEVLDLVAAHPQLKVLVKEASRLSPEEVETTITYVQMMAVKASRR